MESRMLGEPWHEDGRLEIECISINPVGEDEITYCIRARLAQPPPNISKHLAMVIGPRRQCGHIKMVPRNVSRTREGGRTYLGRVHVIQSTWKPKRGVIRLKVLTFKCRMPGEPWCDVDDYR